MFGIHDFGFFLVAGILLNLTPGPDTAYILGRSIAQGREAGIASALGICVGSIFHTSAAALGLSAILATSALAFGAIKLLGGVYLVFLGLKMIFERGGQLSLPSNFRRRTRNAAFRQGILTNVLNPKVALFFLAFLPQFIDPASNAKVLAFVVLGLTFVTTGTVWCVIVAWFASALSGRIRNNETIGRSLNRAAGALFVLIGVRLVTVR
ncbi:MAG TPA: LysE family translocator [Candidatus Udaeobacter sp.]|nr:LysE family translocator [Candidatus Udaeobacter sp.]